MVDTVAQKKEERATKKIEKVKDRRRFKVTPVPMGEPARVASADVNGPLFPNMVREPSESESVLKDGSSNCKIGGDVLIGALRGARIVTLTLPERMTCPRSCDMWRACYGNGMQHSRRWRPGPALEERLWWEVDQLCRHHEKVLVRLHVLGDFYSPQYVKLWADLLDEFEGLHVFGFTAWKPHTEIGRCIEWLRNEAPDRFAIRTSGQGGRWGSFTLPFPTEAKMIGDAIVCPEQRYAALPTVEAKARMAGKKRGAIHCGNCAVCWQSDRPVAFIVH